MSGPMKFNWSENDIKLQGLEMIKYHTCEKHVDEFVYLQYTLVSPGARLAFTDEV